MGKKFREPSHGHLCGCGHYWRHTERLAANLIMADDSQRESISTEHDLAHLCPKCFQSETLRVSEDSGDLWRVVSMAEAIEHTSLELAIMLGPKMALTCTAAAIFYRLGFDEVEE